MALKDIVYEQVTPLLFTNDLIAECSKLYSEHYGIWSEENPVAALRGKNIRLSTEKLREWFTNQKSHLYTAKDNNKIIGYAIALRVKVPYWGWVSWVTQLVVHAEYRNKDIAKNILYSIWCESSNYAWGIISANPYAIRALEKATRRRASPKLIHEKIERIIVVGKDNLPYIKADIEYCANSSAARVNTNFFVDHSHISETLKRVITDEVPWLLGELPEGWEWIAFTFNKQEQIELSALEISEMLTTSEMVNRQAYERMQLSSNQTWMNNTQEEVDFIVRECDLRENDVVYDFGCGIGRHAFALSKRGMAVTGIDYVKSNINRATQSKGGCYNPVFIDSDCRTISLPQKAKAIICLYDVIGSFIDEDSNRKILENIARHLQEEGTALISVMNFETTDFHAKHHFEFSKSPNILLNIAASQTMEDTGNIFNPDYYMIDDETKIVYRKERFAQGNDLPVELIVRDKRYTAEEIESLCSQVGLRIIYSRYVNARNWNVNQEATSKAAKEILVKCIKA